jgi:hypothetical protein
MEAKMIASPAPKKHLLIRIPYLRSPKEITASRPRL